MVIGATGVVMVLALRPVEVVSVRNTDFVIIPHQLTGDVIVQVVTHMYRFATLADVE